MIYIQNKDVVKRHVAGETFLIPIRDRLADMRNIYVLHGVGEFIWDRLGEDAEGICEAVAAEYAVGREDAKRDTEEFLSELEGAGLAEKYISHRDAE